MHAFHRKSLLCAPLLLLAACAGRQEPVPNAAPVASTNAVLFDPTPGGPTEFVPLPNILATASVTTDPLTGRAPASPMNPLDALVYINMHEVGSTSAVSGVNTPIYLRFTYPVDPATVAYPASANNIKVFLLTGPETAPLTFTDVSAAFTPQYTAGSTDLFLYPTFPMLPGAKYLWVVTSGVHDASTGAAVVPSIAFSALEGTTAPSGAFAALAPVWADATAGGNIILRGYNSILNDLTAASATTKIASRAQVALMGRFITSGAGYVPETATGPEIPVEAALRSFSAGTPYGLGPAWNNTATITAQLTGANLEAFWEGVTGQSATSPNLVPVPASIGSIVMGTINTGQLSLDPVVVASNPTSMNQNMSSVTVGETSYPAYDDAAGVLQAFRSDTGVLGGFYYTDATVPFLYLVPATAAPAGGYPLVIYQHGITSQKETVILLGQALTSAGYAALAIDLPEHGALAPNGTSPAQWGQLFMALGAPLATRTNLQQAAFNLNRLEMSVTFGGLATGLAGAGLGTLAPAMSNYKFVGISLGSIVGAYYLAGNTTLATSGLPYSQSSLDTDMRGYLSVPGGRLAYIIQGSPAFAPAINAGLAQMQIPTGSPIYNQFFQLTQAVVDTADPASMVAPLVAGLPSRLSGRVLMQEATSTTATNGDQVIPNPFNRYFGNALGGEAVLGTEAAAAIAPGFDQLAYVTGNRIPSQFMFALGDTGLVPKDEDAGDVTALTASTPTEGYFQFDRTGISHGALLDLTNPVNAGLLQTQMVYFLNGFAVDPTTVPTGAGVTPTPLPSASAPKVHVAPTWRIFGH